MAETKIEEARKHLSDCSKIQMVAYNNTGQTSSRIDALMLAIHALADLLESQGEAPPKERLEDE